MPGRNVKSMRRAVAEMNAFATAGAIALLQQILVLNNEGGGGAPPAPIDTGELRGSPRVTVGAPSTEGPDAPPFSIISQADVARAIQLGGFNLGDVIFITWVALHAAIIDDGRRIGSHGRMIGSEQAPDGWVEQDARVASDRQKSWIYDPTGVL